MNAARPNIIVSGMISAQPRHGGAAWATLQYVLGLRSLGCAVTLIEPLRNPALQPAGSTLGQSTNAAYFREVVNTFDLAEHAALLHEGTTETVGVPYEVLRKTARSADVLVNLSGLLTDEALIAPIPRRLYVDLDPGFTQLWQSVHGINMRLDGHTHFATVGPDIGRPGCPVPSLGRRWIGTLPPVVLEHWVPGRGLLYDGLTTVAQWRGYGSIEFNGTTFGQRAHCFRQFISLPTRTPEKCMPALAIHPDERRDLEALSAHGWELLDPARLTGTPEDYKNFVAGSKGELSLPKSGYVVGDCGWFSDRSACYLASGRPVVALETGFSRHLPTGRGLLAFQTIDDAVARIDDMNRDYAGHARAARAIAVEHLASNRVLSGLLARVGVDL